MYRDEARANQVGIYIDGANCADEILGIADKANALAESEGAVVERNVYADFAGDFQPDQAVRLILRGYRLIHAPLINRKGKRSDDPLMALDIALLPQRRPAIRSILVCGGDADMIPAIVSCRVGGIRVAALVLCEGRLSWTYDALLGDGSMRLHDDLHADDSSSEWMMGEVESFDPAKGMGSIREQSNGQRYAFAVEDIRCASPAEADLLADEIPGHTVHFQVEAEAHDAYRARSVRFIVAQERTTHARQVGTVVEPTQTS